MVRGELLNICVMRAVGQSSTAASSFRLPYESRLPLPVAVGEMQLVTSEPRRRHEPVGS